MYDHCLSEQSLFEIKNILLWYDNEKISSSSTKNIALLIAIGDSQSSDCFLVVLLTVEKFLFGASFACENC